MEVEDKNSNQFLPPPIPNLEEEMNIIAKSGQIHGDWRDLKAVISEKMASVLQLWYSKYGFVGPVPQTFEGRYHDLIALLDSFDSPPWTIQRLVELLLNPQSQYSSTHKLMNSIEKLLSVTSRIRISAHNTELAIR